jgi:hypothetical protein
MYCNLHSTPSRDNGAWRLVANADLTPQEFDELRAEYPKFKLTDGARCGIHVLQHAAACGNVPLIEHIVKLGKEGGMSMIDLGDDFGRTALYLAVQENHLDAVKTLLALGANPNIYTVGCGDSFKGNTPHKATPLWEATYKTKNSEIIQTLHSAGAIILPEPLKENPENYLPW